MTSSISQTNVNLFSETEMIYHSEWCQITNLTWTYQPCEVHPKFLTLSHVGKAEGFVRVLAYPICLEMWKSHAPAGWRCTSPIFRVRSFGKCSDVSRLLWNSFVQGCCVIELVGIGAKAMSLWFFPDCYEVWEDVDRKAALSSFRAYMYRPW